MRLYNLDPAPVYAVYLTQDPEGGTLKMVGLGVEREAMADTPLNTVPRGSTSASSREMYTRGRGCAHSGRMTMT